MIVMTPPPTPPSPAGSVFDMSDDDEGEYNTIRHAASGRGVKLLYSKSKVYVHPSASSKDNIPGFMALVQQKPASSLDRPESSSSAKRTPQETPSSSLLLAWVPESSLPSSAYDAYVKVDLSESQEPPRQSYLVPPPPTSSASVSSSLGAYAFATPVSEIYSLLIRPPSIGWWHGSVVINTRAGGNFPALFFHDSECHSTILQRKRRQKETFDPFGEAGGMFWGGDEVLRWLRRYVTVERAEHDLNIYLIEPSDEDRVGFATKTHPTSTASQPQRKPPPSQDAAMDPVTKTLKEARWGLLERFSQVTTFARRTAQNIVDHPSMPQQAKRLVQNPEVQTIQDEFDSARLYLARWAMGIAEQSEKERRQRIWTARDVMETEETPVGDFEILDMEANNLSFADRRRPVNLREWEGYFDPETGQLRVTVDEVKERIFHGGLDPEDGVRQEAWMFLLGIYDWHSTKDERQSHMHYLRDEYIRLKGSWWERLADPEEPAAESANSPSSSNGPMDSIADLHHTRAYQKEQRLRIEKDVHRTDRHVSLFSGEDIPHPDPDSPFAETGTNVHLEQMKDMLLTYNEYNTSLGYVQGMSDLLAPIYAVAQDDAIAFWGFVGFMKRMERNFLRSQAGMRAQLLTLDQLVQLMDPALYEHLQKVDSTNFFFFFRMLLVWYKREFPWDDVLRLWETLWTDYLSSSFHLFFALAILQKHRDVIIDHLRGFDEVLKYVNELSQNIDLPSTLIRAESLFRRFQRTVEAIDRKTHFPSPTDATLRQRNPSSPQPAPQQPGPRQGQRRPGPKSYDAGDTKRIEHARQAGREAETGQAPQTSARSDARLQGARRLDEADEADVAGRVVSPELRSLLSREVPVMKEEEVLAEGGGVGR